LRPPRKTLVEGCSALSVADILDGRQASEGAAVSSIHVPRGTGAIVVQCSLVEGSHPRTHLRYVLDGEDFRYRVRLDKTSPNFGGVRWWLLCPIEHDGTECGNRVSRLYLPLGEKYFGCRVCHDLTYRSTQAPVVSRLRGFVAALDLYRQLLESRNPIDQIGALVGAKSCIESFIASIGRPRRAARV
jgi:hypothetical protein